MKKILSIALAVMMIAAVLAVSAFADGAVITAPEQEAQPGETVSYSISVSGNPGVSAFRFPLSYDSRLTNNGYTAGSGFVATYIDYVVLDSSVDVTADGAIITFSFTVPADAQPGDKFPITLGAVQAVNKDLNDVEASSVSGMIYIPGEPESPTPGTESPTPGTESPTPVTESPIPDETETPIPDETETPVPPSEAPKGPTPTPAPNVSPRTGDSLFIGLCLLAVCCGAAFVIVTKKRASEK